MKLRAVLVGILCLVVVAAALTLYAWSSKPQLAAIYPAPGARSISAVAPIRLEFSRSMDHASVETRLKVNSANAGTYTWENNILIFSPDKLWAGGQEITVRLDEGARAATWLAFPMGAQNWAFSIRPEALAYLWPASGLADIYEIDPSTGSTYQYTHALNVLDYSTNRDGSVFYFSAGNSQGGADLYQLDRKKPASAPELTYQPEKVLDCGTNQCRNPVVAWDAATIAYEYLRPTVTGGLGYTQVWTLNLADGVTDPIGPAGHETVQPAWSSTGLLAFYDRTNNAYEIVNPATQEMTQVANQTGQPGAWSPDGKYYLAPEITYQPVNGGAEIGSSHLLRYQIPGTTSQDISGLGAVEDVEAAYSPGGGMVAFARKYLDAQHWSLGRQIWIMKSDGSDPHPITNESDTNHYDLAWSLDESKLAYVKFNQLQISEPPELWMINTDGTSPVQLMVGGYSPTWIP